MLRFDGGKFSAANTYTLVLSRKAALAEDKYNWRHEINQGRNVKSETALEIRKADIAQEIPRGSYSVTVLENGEALPISVDLEFLLEEGEKPLIQPTVKINGGASYTTSRTVTIKVDPGTYTKFKMAETEAGLETAFYSEVSTSFSYTFKDESYGTKTVYFVFKDEDGNETGTVSASIRYVSGLTSPPKGYGIDGDELPANQTIVLPEGSRITFWLKSDLASGSASISFWDAAGNVLLSQNLWRGAKEQSGLYTYSRTLTVDRSTLGAARWLEFCLQDVAAQSAWQSGQQAIQVAEAAAIAAASCQFEFAYFNGTDQQFVKRKSPVYVRVEGTPGREVSAVLYYDTETVEGKTAVIPLEEKEGVPGVYVGQGAVPEGAVKVTRITYTLSGAQPAEKQESFGPGLLVAGEATFRLANSQGELNGLWLRLDGNGIPLYYNGRQCYVSKDETQVDFSPVMPGTYTYSLYDSYRTYAKGEINVGNGEAVDVDLTGEGAPAELELTVGNGLNGYVSYRVEDSTGNVVTASASCELKDGKALIKGLKRGDAVKYRVTLNWDHLLVYQQPEEEFSVSVTAAKTSQIVNIPEIATVKLSGRVIDKDRTVGGDKVPLAGAVVAVYQVALNGGRMVYNNRSVTVGDDGRFELNVFQGCSGIIHIQKEGYRTLQENIDEKVQDTDLGDRELECYNRNYIDVRLEVAPAVRQGEESVYLPAGGRIRYVEAFKGTTKLRGWYSFYNARFYLEEGQGLSAGDSVTLKAYIDPWGGAAMELENQGEAGVTLTSHLTGEATFKARKLGYIEARPVSEGGAGTTCYMLVFDNQNRRMGIVSGTGAVNTSNLSLPAGQYRLIFMSGQDLSKINRLTDPIILEQLGLSAGVHYVERNATVESGTITELGEVKVPVVSDDDLGYLALEGTSISAKQLEVAGDGSVKAQVTVRYFMNERVGKSGIQAEGLQVSLSGGKVSGNSCYFNGKTVPVIPGVQSLGISKGYVDMGSQGMLTFEVEMSEETVLDVAAYVNLRRNNPYLWLYESIGQASFNFSAVSIVSPEEAVAADNLSVTVRGVAPKNREVKIWDNGIMVGQTKADDRGRWQAKVDLVQPQRPSLHVLQAVVEMEGKQISQYSYTRVLGKNAPVVDDVTIWQPTPYGDRFKLDFKTSEDAKKAIAVINPYYPVKGRFKLLNVTPDKVDYAAFVNDYRGITTLFPASYNTQTGYWEAEFKLPSPGEISVVYGLKVPEDDNDPAFDVSYLTGSLPIDLTALPDKPVDPSVLPEEIRQAGVSVGQDGQQDPDNISADMTIKGAQGGTAQLHFSAHHERVTVDLAQLQAQGFVRIDTTQGFYYTKAPQISFGSVDMTKTVYFSPELYKSLGGEGAIPEGTSTTQVVLDKADYVSYLSGELDLIVSTSQNPNALGSVGTGMTVLGGAVLAGQVVLGRVGKDP
ncbi:MAG TPA: hypothetical protein PLE01_04060, partial [Syntrophothermus lipocalidus]|nr:hypothetical protein [Syntrophothermus lipocalidus]